MGWLDVAWLVVGLLIVGNYIVDTKAERDMSIILIWLLGSLAVAFFLSLLFTHGKKILGK